MKKLKCILEVPKDVYSSNHTTVGKVYLQRNSYDDITDYFIIDDTGKERYYEKWFFEEVKSVKVKKDKREKMFKKTIKQLKSFHELNFDINTVDIEYGYFRNAEGEHERDGSCTITIKVNKTK